jgi:DNA-binding MarR family transcriptional regulator
MPISPAKSTTSRRSPPRTGASASANASARKTAPVKRKGEEAAQEPAVDQVDTRFLQTLVGYGARRVSLTTIASFLPRMAVYDLRPVEFSVLSLIHHNPGITSRQLCSTLSIQPPNLVGMLQKYEKKRGLIERRPHPHDGRALGLHLTPAGLQLVRKAERAASENDAQVTARLSAAERRTLLRLLGKIYL